MKKKIRRILNRLGHRYCPICKEQAILVTHHINGRAVKDWDEEYNKCDICSNCHVKQHNGEINILTWVRTSNGLELIYDIK